MATWLEDETSFLQAKALLARRGPIDEVGGLRTALDCHNISSLCHVELHIIDIAEQRERGLGTLNLHLLGGSLKVRGKVDRLAEEAVPGH